MAASIGVAVGCPTVSGVAAAGVVGVGAAVGAVVGSSSLAHARATAIMAIAKTAIAGFNMDLTYSLM